MAKKKSDKTVKEYTVLISCGDGKKEYGPGDTVTDKDFKAAVIKNWLEIEPPVLKVKA